MLHALLNTGSAPAHRVAQNAVFLTALRTDTFDINTQRNMFLRACIFGVGLIDVQAHELPHIGHIIPIAAIRLSHIGLAVGIQILGRYRVMRATCQAERGVGGVIEGAIEEHADTQSQLDLLGRCGRLAAVSLVFSPALGMDIDGLGVLQLGVALGLGILGT
ncbi:hypothetical protein [Stutzerimonas stutzeri]|uniref:hypothetical protein n=1 Tax=Stutzerimonas stutzeri TaxID=316 RepID=UPI001F52475A|nr:hypothetical protein [Stutzerimonas stutzeri]